MEEAKKIDPSCSRRSAIITQMAPLFFPLTRLEISSIAESVPNARSVARHFAIDDSHGDEDNPDGQSV
jgi:hypothetical protein